MTAVRVAQLIYSNVEAEHSPTGRRGFQVWLCSRRLKDGQREIARRLEDFDWPTPDAAADRLTERLCFFRTAAGEFVVARTVPVAERDALRRAGRFHAHAVVLPAAEFARVGNDPFAVFDHFPFQNSPAAVIESGSWQSGSLPDDEEIPVGPPRGPDPGFAAAVGAALPLLVRWLDGPDDGRPVAAAVPPDVLAGFLRAAFRSLPPGLRARTTFDTLSTGQALGPLPYRFAGGYDAASVRDWPYRRAYRLDVRTGEFPTPPAAPEHPGLDHLAAEWSADPGLTDDDKETAYQLVKLLDQGAELPAGLTERALGVVQSAPGAEAGLAKRVRDRVAADLPFPQLQPLVLPAAEEWVGPLSREALTRLGEPIPVPHLAGWLYDYAERYRLTPEQAAELERWACEQMALGKLHIIAIRWQTGAAKKLAGLRGKDGWPELIDGWFLDWFLAGSPIRDFLQPGSAAQLAEAVMAGSPRLSPDVLPDLDLFLGASGTLPTAIRKPLGFAVAYRAGDPDGMAELLADRGDRPFAEWVVGQLVPLGVTLRLGLGAEDRPGLILETGPRADAGRLGVLFDVLAGCPVAQFALLERAWELAGRLAPTPVVYPEGALAAAEKAYQASRFDRVEAELDRLGASEFRQFLTEHLHDKSRVTRPCASRTPGGLWVGPAIESNGLYPEVFDKLTAAVVGAIRRTPGAEAERVAAMLCAVRVRTA